VRQDVRTNSDLETSSEVLHSRQRLASRAAWRVGLTGRRSWFSVAHRDLARQASHVEHGGAWYRSLDRIEVESCDCVRGAACGIRSRMITNGGKDARMPAVWSAKPPARLTAGPRP
jgi:hypothetical protein